MTLVAVNLRQQAARKVLSTMFMFLLCGTYASISTSPAFAYSCTGMGGPCYGENVWPGRIGGAFSQATLVTLTAPTYQSTNYVEEKEWVGDSISNGCSTSCFAEVGYGTFNDSGSSEDYFYSWLPTYGTIHFIVPGAVTLYGSRCALRATQLSNGTFNLGVCEYNGIYAQMTLTPNSYTEGLELGGTYGASAPTVHFINNLYYDANLSQAAYTQQSKGNLLSQPPAYGSWSILPTSQNSGGDFQTSCGC